MGDPKVVLALGIEIEQTCMAICDESADKPRYCFENLGI